MPRKVEIRLAELRAMEWKRFDWHWFTRLCHQGQPVRRACPFCLATAKREFRAALSKVASVARG